MTHDPAGRDEPLPRSNLSASTLATEQTGSAEDGGSDRLFADPGRALVDFAFDTQVAAVFPDMIRRSVPGYETVVPLSGLIAAERVQGGVGTRVYDLGCSLGATTLAVLDRLGTTPAEIHAIDNAPAMIAEARVRVSDPRVTFTLADVRALPFAPAAVVLLNYVLQFIPLPDRLPLLTRIHQALLPGGCLLISGKVSADDPAQQALYDSTHLAFKRANGYSELEIAGKRSALERVMPVATERAHHALFAAAGFRTVHTWYRCLNWAAFLLEP